MWMLLFLWRFLLRGRAGALTQPDSRLLVTPYKHSFPKTPANGVDIAWGGKKDRCCSNLNLPTSARSKPFSETQMSLDILGNISDQSWRYNPKVVLSLQSRQIMGKQIGLRKS